MTYHSRSWWRALIRRIVTVLGPVSVHTMILISTIYVWSVPVLQGHAVSLGMDLESEM